MGKEKKKKKKKVAWWKFKKKDMGKKQKNMYKEFGNSMRYADKVFGPRPGKSKPVVLDEGSLFNKERTDE